MLETIKENITIYQAIVAVLLLLGTVFSVYTPDLFVLKIGAQFAAQFMFLCLFLGFLFMFLRSTNLMFVSFAACALLCIFLKASFHDTEHAAFYPKLNGEPVFKVAHFNVGTTSQSPPSMIETILTSDADVVSIQELTFDWNMFLKNGLKNKYPYSESIVRLDFRGLAIYSKYPLTQVDTFHYKESPNIYGNIQIDDRYDEVFFVYSNTEPPVNIPAFGKIRRHLSQVADMVKNIDVPVLTLGAYNVVPWSYELKSFRTKTGLCNGRRDFMPNLLNNSALRTPTYHILHSNKLECIDFQTLSDSGGDYVGVIGQFQYKPIYAKGSIQ